MKPTKRTLPCFLAWSKRFEDAALAIGQFGVVVEGDAVDLPEVEMVGLQAPQRLLQHLHGQFLAAAVRANLGHQEDFVAPALEAAAHPVFRLAVVVFPAVVEERDARVDGLVDQLDGVVHGLQIAEMMSADAEGRHFHIGTAERPHRYFAGCHGSSPVRARVRSRADRLSAHQPRP